MTLGCIMICLNIVARFVDAIFMFQQSLVIMVSVSEAAALVVSTAEVSVNLGAAPGTPNKASSLLCQSLCHALWGAGCH